MEGPLQQRDGVGRPSLESLHRGPGTDYFGRRLAKAFADRKLEGKYPYLILDARYEKVRENEVVSSRAVLIAIGVNTEGKREVLGVENANRKSTSSWKDFISHLLVRGLSGLQLVI